MSAEAAHCAFAVLAELFGLGLKNKCESEVWPRTQHDGNNASSAVLPGVSPTNLLGHTGDSFYEITCECGKLCLEGHCG